MADWSWSTGDPKKNRRSLLSGIIIGALLGGIAWGAVSALVGSGSSGAPGEHLTAQGGATASGAPASAGPADRRLARCRRVYADQQLPLAAAGTSMTQWQVHIAAMNKLVLGVITPEQALQFWNRTRIGAKARLKRFHDAAARLGRLTIRCPTPGTDSSAAPRLVRCERAVAADTRVLDLARTALGTWAMHVKHMDMLRDGQMSAAQAAQLWLQNWHQGQREVTRYATATKEAGRHGCTTPRAS